MGLERGERESQDSPGRNTAELSCIPVMETKGRQGGSPHAKQGKHRLWEWPKEGEQENRQCVLFGRGCWGGGAVIRRRTVDVHAPRAQDMITSGP